MSEQNHPATAPGLARKIVMFPLVRIIIGLVFILATVLIISAIFRPLGHALFPGDERPVAWVSAMWVFSSIMITLAYLAFLRFVERRDFSELSRERALPETAAGYGIGALLMILSVGILWLMGSYHPAGVGSATILLVPFLSSIFTGFFEEILFRGILFRIIQESLGTWIAVIASALIFGFAHGGNPNATMFSSTAIALEAGILLSAVYLYTNRLWMVIAMHAAWNFTQGAIFGINVSGTTTSEGLIQADITGHDLITGGAFGIEASLVTIILCTATGILFLYLAHRKGNFVKPFWRRPKSTPLEVVETEDTEAEPEPTA